MTQTKTRAAFLAAVIAAGALGAAGMAVLKPAGAQAQNAAPLQNGRYVIVHSPHAREDTMLLDTATGRTWSPLAMLDLNTEPVAWEPVAQLNTDADRNALVEKYGKKAD